MSLVVYVTYMHVKTTIRIINFVAKFDQDGVPASMFGLEQRKEVVLAAMIGLEDRQNVAREQRLAWRIARRSPGTEDWPGRSPEGHLAAKIGLKCRRKLARRAPEGRRNVACSKDWPAMSPTARQKACKSAWQPDWPEMSPEASQNGRNLPEMVESAESCVGNPEAGQEI